MGSFSERAGAFLEIKISLKQRRPLFWDPFAKGPATFLEIKIPLKQRRPLFWKSPLGKVQPLFWKPFKTEAAAFFGN